MARIKEQQRDAALAAQTRSLGGHLDVCNAAIRERKYSTASQRQEQVLYKQVQQVHT